MVKGKKGRKKWYQRPFEYATRIALMPNCFAFGERFDILPLKTWYLQFWSIRAVLIHILNV